MMPRSLSDGERQHVVGNQYAPFGHGSTTFDPHTPLTFELSSSVNTRGLGNPRIGMERFRLARVEVVRGG
jgi:hypothetical protein